MLLDTSKWFDEFVGEEDWKSIDEDSFHDWVLDDGFYKIRHIHNIYGYNALLEVLNETRTMNEEDLNDWGIALEQTINYGEYNETIFDIIDNTLEYFIRLVLMREYKERLG